MPRNRVRPIHRSQPASCSVPAGPDTRRIVLGLAMLLATVLAAALLESPAAATPALASPSLSNVSISLAGGSPGTVPVTVVPGGQFIGWFFIDNPSGPEERAALGLSVVGPGGTEVPNANPLPGASCLVPANASNFLCSLPFTVPSSTAPGSYTVRFTISPIVPTVPPWGSTVDRAGWLLVQGGPQLCVSPTSMDFGSAGTSSSLSVQNCGGGSLTWSVSSNQPWLTLGASSGSGTANLAVSVNRSGLAAGSYSGAITVSSNGGTQSVPVSMQVLQNAALAGQVTGLAVNPTPTSPGTTAQITANVANTGNVTTVYHLFTNPESICGQQDWIGTVNVGQSTSASILCNVPGGIASGNYLVNVSFEVAQPGQAFQNRQSVGTVAVAVGPSVTPTPVPTAVPAQGPGIFFSQTGFWVRDAAFCLGSPGTMPNYLSEFNRLGGIPTLGYPASRPYWDAGFCYQVFQRGILQWRPDYSPPQAVLANTLDWLHDAGKDGFLLGLGVPLHFTGNDGSEGNFSRAIEIRLQWLTDPDIRAAYLANPNPAAIPDTLWDPVTFYGLPTSQPELHGPFIAQRFQRYVLQKWVAEVPGMPPAGSVVGVLAGDLAKQAGGIVPAAAAEPESP